MTRSSATVALLAALLLAGSAPALAQSPVPAASFTATDLSGGALGVRGEDGPGAGAGSHVRHQRRPVRVARPGSLHRAVPVHRRRTASASSWTPSRSRRRRPRSRPSHTCRRCRCPTTTPRGATRRRPTAPTWPVRPPSARAPWRWLGGHDRPDFPVVAMCVFPDGSMIDEWGLAYHSDGTVRGIDLALEFVYRPHRRTAADLRAARPWQPQQPFGLCVHATPSGYRVGRTRVRLGAPCPQRHHASHHPAPSHRTQPKCPPGKISLRRPPSAPWYSEQPSSEHHVR